MCKVTQGQPEIFRVTPGATKSFGERKAAAGQTYWNPNINETNFSLEAVTGEVELMLHHFGESVSDIEATRRLSAMGLIREKRLSVILAFLDTYPNLQREFPIITSAAWADLDGY